MSTPVDMPPPPNSDGSPPADPNATPEGVSKLVAEVSKGITAPTAPAGTLADPAAPEKKPDPKSTGVPADPATPEKKSDSKSIKVPDALLGEPGAEKTEARETPPGGSKEENMAAMRARIEAQQKIIDEFNELKAQYIAEDGSFKLPKEVEEQVKTREIENQKLRDELGRLNFARSPEFQSRYQAPVEAAFRQITELFESLEVPAGTAETLVNLAPKDRLTYFQKNHPEMAGVLFPLYSQLDQTIASRNQALQDHQTLAQKLQSDAVAEKTESTRKEREGQVAQALEVLLEDGYFPYRKVAGDEEWNGHVDTLNKTLRDLVVEGEQSQQVQAMALGVAAPVYRHLYEQERVTRDALETELKRYRKAVPRLPGGSRTPAAPGAPGPEVPEGGMALDSAVSAVMGKMNNSI